MKKNPVALGNAVGLLAALWYVLCALFVSLAPGFARSISDSWFYWIDVKSLYPPTGPVFEAGRFVTGLVSLTVLGWLSGWFVGVAYNAFEGKRGDRG